MISFPIFFLILISCYDSNVICIDISDNENVQLAFNYVTDPGTYHKWIRPPANGTNRLSSSNEKGPLIVNVSIDLYNYAIVDEITSEYTFHLFIDFEWFDSRLKFPPSSDVYDEANIIEGGQLHIERIWTPPVFVPNNQDPGSFDYDNHSANMLRVRHDGYVWMRKRKMLRIYCDMDFRQYPFDQQKCEVHFESSTYTVNNLILQWNTVTEFSTAQSFRTIGFTLKGYETTSSEKTNSKGYVFSRASIKFLLEREWAHYMFMFYLPSGLIVITSWCSFWLEITSPPARVSIGVTTMLALVTTFKSTKSQLPSVSYWNALDIWNMVCIIFIFSSLVEFACVNYIFNTEKRKRKNKKLKIKKMRRKSIAEPLSHTSRISSVSSLESIYTMSSILSFNNRISETSEDGQRRRSSVSNSSVSNHECDQELGKKEPIFDLSKRRRSSVTFDSSKLMPDIKEEPTDPLTRPRSNTNRSRRASVAQQAANDNSLQLTSQEVANLIDEYSRRIFPLSFLIFNLLYWCILQIKI